MTWPEYFGSLAILCFFYAFAAYIWADLTKVGGRPGLADSSLGADGNDTRHATSIYDQERELA